MHFFCLSMQEKLPVAGPFHTKNAEYGDFEQKTIYSFITYAKIYKYLLTFSIKVYLRIKIWIQNQISDIKDQKNVSEKSNEIITRR